METINLLTVVGTLAVTAFGALLGAWIQSYREHTKWKRERTYEAYMLFFYEVSRVLGWTQEVRQGGETDCRTNREEAEGIWRMSAAVNMHLPEKLSPDFASVNTFLGSLSEWGRSSSHDPVDYEQILRDGTPALNRLQEAMRADLKLDPKKFPLPQFLGSRRKLGV